MQDPAGRCGTEPSDHAGARRPMPCRMAGPRGTPEVPRFIKQYRALIAGGPDETLPAEGTLRDHLFKDSRKGRVFPVSRPRKGVQEAVLEYRLAATAEEMERFWRTSPSTPGGPIRSGCSSHPGSIRWPRRQIRKPRKARHCAPERPAPPGDRKAPAWNLCRHPDAALWKEFLE